MYRTNLMCSSDGLSEPVLISLYTGHGRPCSTAGHWDSTFGVDGARFVQDGLLVAQCDANRIQRDYEPCNREGGETCTSYHQGIFERQIKGRAAELKLGSDAIKRMDIIPTQECVKCPAGSYKTGDECIRCPAGRTTEGPGAASKAECSVECLLAPECHGCGRREYVHQTGNSTTCVPCIGALASLTGDRCVGACPEGQRPSEAAGRCVCSASTYLNRERDACVDSCGRGWAPAADAALGMAVCRQCPAGTVSDGTAPCGACGANAALDESGQYCRCEPGHMSVDDRECRPCGENAAYSEEEATCVCNDGYIGSGLSCEPLAASPVVSIVTPIIVVLAVVLIVVTTLFIVKRRKSAKQALVRVRERSRQRADLGSSRSDMLKADAASPKASRNAVV